LTEEEDEIFLLEKYVLTLLVRNHDHLHFNATQVDILASVPVADTLLASFLQVPHVGRSVGARRAAVHAEAHEGPASAHRWRTKESFEQCAEGAFRVVKGEAVHPG
jgi:hypothetical protein